MAVNFRPGYDDSIIFSTAANAIRGAAAGTIAFWFRSIGTTKLLTTYFYQSYNFTYLQFGENTGSLSNESVTVALYINGAWRCLAGNETSNTLYLDGQWHHCALTVGNGPIALYIDGQPITLSVADGNLNNDGIFAWTATVTAHVMYPSYTYGGLMADLRLYTRRLAAAEVHALYRHRGADRVLANRAVRCPFFGTNGAAATTVADEDGRRTYAAVAAPTYLAAPFRRTPRTPQLIG